MSRFPAAFLLLFNVARQSGKKFNSPPPSPDLGQKRGGGIF